MDIARNLISTFAAAAIAASAAVAMSPNAAADPAPPAPSPAQQLPALPGLPGLPAMSELSPIIQQAAGNPEQATQLLMAAAQAFSHNPSAPEQSKSVAESVNQFVTSPPEAASTAHVVPPGVEPGAQAHLPTGIDPVHAAGPAPEAAAPAPANAVPVAAAAPPVGLAPAAPAPAPEAAVPAPAPAAAAPGFSPDAPPTQDFIYPSISNNCGADGGTVMAPVLSVAGPAKIPTPGPNAGQTAYVFTAVGTPGPADVQKLPLNVTWVNLTTGKSGSATLKPQPDINPQGPTTLIATVDTGSGSIMSTIFGQVSTKDKQCQFMPTIGSTVVP
jgi:hypothetical protein